MEDEDGTTSEEVEEDRASKTKRTRRFSIFLSILVTALLVSSIFGYYSNSGEEDWREGGTTEWTEDRVPRSYLYLIMPDWGAARIANDHIRTLGVGNVSTVNINEDDTGDSQLVLDHEMGHVLYWELWDDDVEVDINALTGEMICYFKSTEHENGTATRQEIEDMAVRIAEHWGGVPSDAVGPFIEYDTWMSENDWDIYEWYVYWYREKDGIQTTDHIRMYFDLDGTLNFYFRDWNMDLAGTDTSYTVTREEAIAIARDIAGEQAPFVSCEKRIVRPTDALMGEEILWGTRPTCIWSVEFDYNNDTYIAYVGVHARTGEVVDGDWYC